VNRIGRFASGACVGVALLSAGVAVAPAAASSTSGGFCDETQNYVCCCTTFPDGTIQSCECTPKQVTGN
jgi:hypothetical protein